MPSPVKTASAETTKDPINRGEALAALIGASSNFLFMGHVYRQMRCICRATSRACQTAFIGLLPHQHRHLINVVNILRTERRCLDTSAMGAGKTYTALHAARFLDKEVVVFGPYLTQMGWKDACEALRFPTGRFSFYPYSAFQSKEKPFIAAHATRGEWVDGVWKVTEFEYSADSEWVMKMERGAIVVWDESQCLKNKSQRTKHAICLTTVALRLNGAVLCLSATPFDKAEHTVNMLRLLGIIRHPRLAFYNLATRLVEYEGLAELIQYCRNSSARARNDIIHMPHGVRGCDKMAHLLTIRYVKPKLFCAMRAPPKRYELDARNYFCNIDDEGAAIVNDGVRQLRRAMTAMVMADAEARADALGAITKGLRTIECGKARLFVRLAMQHLLTNLESKVIVMLNYTEPLQTVEQHLGWCNPLVIYGPTSKANRAKAIRAFQSRSLVHRVLITNITVTALGINLDDRDGDRPRLLLISPSYMTINLHQACGRIDRATTASQPTAKYVYVKAVQAELKILDALARKSSVIRSTLRYDTMFPGDHARVYEED